jgi:hypothetical protein
VTSVYGAGGVAHSDLEMLRTAKIVMATPEKLDFAVRQEWYSACKRGSSARLVNGVVRRMKYPHH